MNYKERGIPISPICFLFGKKSLAIVWFLIGFVFIFNFHFLYTFSLLKSYNHFLSGTNFGLVFVLLKSFYFQTKPTINLSPTRNCSSPSSNTATTPGLHNHWNLTTILETDQNQNPPEPLSKAKPSPDHHIASRNPWEKTKTHPDLHWKTIDTNKFHQISTSNRKRERERERERERVFFMRQHTISGTHKVVFFFLMKLSLYSFPLKMKKGKRCIHFLYSNSVFWILKMKIEYN